MCVCVCVLLFAYVCVCIHVVCVYRDIMCMHVFILNPMSSYLHFRCNTHR